MSKTKLDYLLMPEGPEVKLLVEQISPCLVGRVIESAQIVGGKYLTKMKIPNWEHFQTSLPQTVQEVGCHGKFIYLRLEGDLALGIGLGMSGTLNFKVDDKQNHIRLGLRSTLGERNKDTLCYYDYRRFGNWCVYLTQAELDRKLNQLGLNILGTDAPTREEVDFVYRRAQNQNICRVLMNQKLFSGIGNCL